jgi:hypothetical protein
MIKTPLAILLVAAAALAGCNQSDHTIHASEPYDPQANAVANSAPVAMPPSIVASHPYRCKDNSLVSIDWLTDGTTNSARATPKGGTAVTLTQAEPNGPYSGEGATLTGTAQDNTITYGGKSCTR